MRSIMLFFFICFSSTAFSDHTPVPADIAREAYRLADNASYMARSTYSDRTISWYANQVHMEASDVYHVARGVQEDHRIEQIEREFRDVIQSFENLRWVTGNRRVEDHNVDRMFHEVEAYYDRLGHAIYGDAWHDHD